LSKCAWTTDTERAFLLALRLTGQAQAAAVEIGRTPQAAYARRKRNAGFREQWEAMVAAQQQAWIAAQQALLAEAGAEPEDGGGQMAPWREVGEGFGTRKRAHFLRVLTRTKHVVAACRAAGVATSTAYALRSRAPRFAAAWEKALADAAPPSVREAALARAVDGWEEPILYGGQVVAHRKRYSDGLLRDLLREEQARSAGGRAPAGAARAVARREAPEQPGRVSEGELNAEILRKMALLGNRQRERARLKTERQWERWRLGWVNPALAAPTAEDLADEAEWECEDDEEDEGEGED